MKTHLKEIVFEKTERDDDDDDDTNMFTILFTAKILITG